MDVIIVGAGPAGLSAAYKLVNRGQSVTILEADPEYVGGIARTVLKNGYRFDVGGHRFFTKSIEVNRFWKEILPEDFLVRPRSSRIYYDGKFYDYPLRPFQALFRLGFFNSIHCVFSFLRAKIFPKRNPKSFEEWVSNQFGSRLFGIFFKSYTEKVWGMKCQEISADWAAQRIAGLSLANLIISGILKPFKKASMKTLTSEFFYPRLGPGMMWEACAKKVRAAGGNIVMGARVVHCKWNNGMWDVTFESSSGDVVKRETIRAGSLVSSAPIGQLIPAIDNQISQSTIKAAQGLRYRNFLTVVLIFDGICELRDQWIYIHDPKLKVGRIQNFRAWSPDLIPHANHQSFGLEFFCWEHDEFWKLDNEALIALAKKEFASIPLASGLQFLDAHVVRQPKAYPVYDEGYEKKVETIRTEIETRFPSFYFVGRNGMHRYNNQDHAVMTGFLAAENICKKSRHFNSWKVNQDAEYHEVEA